MSQLLLKKLYPKKISDNKIKIDGIIGPSEWDGATEIILDNETKPGYNIKPVVETSGYILVFRITYLYKI